MDVINKEKKWKRKRNDGTAKGIVVINTLCKHDDVEEDNKSKSSTNKNKRKMNDVWKAIQYAVAKVKNNKRRKMSDFSEEEEDMSQKTSTTKNKRKRNDAGEEILFSIVKRKRNDVYKAIRYVVNRKRRRKMLNFMPGMSKHQKSSSNTKRKRNDVILPNNKRNYLGKTKEDDDKEHNTSNSIIGDPVYLSDLLFTKKQEILSMKSSTTKNKRKWNHAGEEEILSSSVSNSYLSEDLIFNTLSSTCVTSLLRCKSVCKLWQSIISKPEFMNVHHLNSLNKLPSIMMITSRIDDDAGRRGATIVYPNSSQQHSVNVPLMPPFDELEFIRSFNGVVCVFNYVFGDIYLLNPLTRMFKKLLIPPTAPTSTRKIPQQPPCLKAKVDVGFGFDCVSHDFKVLWIEYQTTRTDKIDVAAVNLYSTNSDSWSKIEMGIELPSLLYHPFCPVLRSGPVINGVLYLEAVNAIITFDLHDELFGLISYPSFIHTRKSSVLDFEGSVAVVLETVPDGSLDEKELSLWTPVAVSDEVVWNKMFTFGSGSEEIDWVFLYSGANQFFGKTRLGEMLYDYKKKQTKYVGLPSQSFLVRVMNHTESFLSVQGFEGIKDS